MRGFFNGSPSRRERKELFLYSKARKCTLFYYTQAPLSCLWYSLSLIKKIIFFTTIFTTVSVICPQPRPK